MLRVQIERVLRQRRGRKVEVNSIGGVVQRLRPDVGSESRKPVPRLGAETRLQRVIHRGTDGCEHVLELEVRVRTVAESVRLVGVEQTGEARALAAHVTDLEGGAFTDFLLDVEVEILHVWRGNVAGRNENAERAAGKG